MDKLHPGARWIFRLNSYSRFGFIFFILIYFLIISSLDSSRYSVFRALFGDSFLLNLIIGLFVSLFFVFIIGEVYARMSYNRWLYEITQDGVKLEHGIIWKKYTSIPYERVQNVNIRRGIIARMFGFSSVDIETAGKSGMGNHYGFRFGGSGYKGYKSEGHLPAIDVHHAEEIRKFIMGKIKQKHGSGL